MPNESSFTDLHRALTDRYDLEELRTLCAQLGVPFDDLRGEGRSAKARELILWLQRHSRLNELIAVLASQEITKVEAPFAPVAELLTRAQEQEDWAEEKPPDQQRKTMTEQTEYKYDAFISYSHADRAWVWDELLPRLERAGLRVCVDDLDFEIGVPSLINMERAVDNSRHTLVVLTPDWIKSEWTEFESLLVGTADPAGRRRKLIPLMLKSCKLPPRIAMLTYADFARPLEHEAQMTRLVRSLGSATETLSHAESSKKRPHMAITPNPFTDTLAIRDPARFVGREALLERLLHLLRGGSVALVGERKIGKSSLLHRLADLLQREPGQVIVFWDFFDPVDVEQLLAQAIKALDSDGKKWNDFKQAVRGRRVVLLLDEFDLAPERGFDLDMLRGCRALCQAERGLRLVTASRVLPKEIFPDPSKGSWPYDFLGVQRLGPFTEDEAQRLLTHPWVSDVLYFDTPTCEELIALSSCHPYRLQRTAHHRYEALCDPTYDWRAAYERDMEALQ